MYTHVHTYIHTDTHTHTNTCAHNIPKNVTLTIMDTNFTIKAVMLLHGFSRGEDALYVSCSLN